MLRWQIHTSKPLFNLWCFYISFERSGSWGFEVAEVGWALVTKMLWGGRLTVGGCLIEGIQYTYKQYDLYVFCVLLFLHQQSWLLNHQGALGLSCISIVLYFQHNQWFAPSIFLKRQNLLICWIPGWSKETGNSIIDETNQDVSKPNYSPIGDLHFLKNIPTHFKLPKGNISSSIFISVLSLFII